MKYMYSFMIILLTGLICLTPAATRAELTLEEQIDELVEIEAQIEANGYTWTPGLTEVSSLDDQERWTLCGTFDTEGYIEPAEDPDIDPDSFPSSFDWRTMGGVSSVKRQKQCGACWAFSATAALESQVMIKSGWQPDLSEQQLVSCNHKGYGCDGGWVDINDHLKSTGMVSEECMPYVANDTEPCIENQCQKIAKIDSWSYLNNSVNTIKNALQSGPVGTAFTVYDDFYYYTGGCYQHTGSSSVNHAILIVGWDDSVCGTGAWIIKNSWGTNWGTNGFGYVKYNSCNIGYGSTKINYTAQNPPTATPTPRPPTRTPTPPPQYTQTPTPTPRPGNPTATPTQIPAESVIIDLLSTKQTYQGGDLMAIDLSIINPGIWRYVDLFVVLDIYGNYYFYPEWSKNQDYERLYLPFLYETTLSILRLQVPWNVQPGGPFYFHSCMCAPGTAILVSNVTSEPFWFR